MHASRIFFLTPTHEIVPVPHECYVQLVRGETTLPHYAGLTMRVADWYIEKKDAGQSALVVNETYSIIVFHDNGSIDWSRCCPPGKATGDAQIWSLSAQEKARLQTLISEDGQMIEKSTRVAAA